MFEPRRYTPAVKAILKRCLWIAAATVCAGCATPRLPINPVVSDAVVSTVCLEQPNCTGRQRKLDLTSAQTWWAADGQTERILAELPLPGATSGRAMFLLYLRITPPLSAPSS